MFLFTKHCPPRRSARSGFTLIELLIVIAILGLLATVVIVNLNPASNLIDTRNSRRGSDVSTIQSALSQYAIRNIGSNPPATIAALVPTYLNVEPKDPNTGASYGYCTSTTFYGIGSTLETGGGSVLGKLMANSTAAAGMPCVPTGVTCETGAANDGYCVRGSM